MANEEWMHSSCGNLIRIFLCQIESAEESLLTL